jgi:FkbM family methyltransferase
MIQKQIVRNLKKALRLAFFQPSVFLVRIKSNILLPVLPTIACEIRVNNIRFQIDPSVAPVMKDMCYGFYETEITTLLKKYVREGDICIDVGANIGYISAFILGLVGKTGVLHSFEPVPEYCDRLKKVQQDNPEYHLVVNAAALGETEGTSKICVTSRDNIGWNTMVPNFMSKATIKEELDIPVKRLDDYIRSNELTKIRLIKIDTEGYESLVLKGLSSFFEQSNDKPILIVEIVPNAYPKLGTSLSELADYMDRHGYCSYNTETQRKADIRTLKSAANILYLHSSVSAL